VNVPTAHPVVLHAVGVVRATAGRLYAGDPATTFAGVSIDSRAVRPGDLFVAIRGERFDGHDFLAEAKAAGAAGALVSRTDVAFDGLTTVLVADTVLALQALARDVRRAAGSVVVAVTGSAGKTTTKELTAALLETTYRVFRSRGNLNNHIGLPLSLLQLADGPDVAVVELGMNHAGEIRTLVQIAEPDIRIWTNVGDAHIGHFGSQTAIAQAKAEILEHAGPTTSVIANADDPLVMSHVRTFRGRVLTFGESPSADVRATDIHDAGFDGTSADIQTPGGRMRLQVPLPGRASLLNVLAAVTAAGELEVPLASIPAAVRQFSPVARRGASTFLPNGVRLVDDSYNASPSAMEVALQALLQTPTAGRRVAVLGEMLELGDGAGALHERCGAAAARVDLLVAVGGPAADGLRRGAIAAGLPANRAHHFDASQQAAEFVSSVLAAGDLVLVKGSRGTRTDIIADRLREVA
jgi:UDP-N-acetylmuramoyl-tripeptide--D-alanyl-D-alanine ligase